MAHFKGKNASPGIAIGRALVLVEESLQTSTQADVDVETEQRRFQNAIRQALQQLHVIRTKTEKEQGAENAAIFESHALVLEDPELIDATIDIIAEKKINAESAFSERVETFLKLFESLSDPYLRERAADLRDVSQRVLRLLLNRTRIDLSELTEDVILVAHDLTPSDTASMNRKHVLGFLTNVGGKTSHTAIMARTLEIPAVLGLRNITSQVRDGDLVVLNGENGEVVVNPEPKELIGLKRLKEDRERTAKELYSLIGVSSQTADGRRIKLMANMGTPQDVPLVQKYDAEGVGLYRTEFLFMNRTQAPSEDEQVEAYGTVLKAMGSRLTVIRTLDIGGDKDIPYLHINRESNPFLGLRAIRYCLQEITFFKTQLRALMRASVRGHLGIMFPMISNVQEVLDAKEVLEDVKRDLIQEGIAFSPDVQIGIMIEVPSAALISDILAQHVDFLSIGTNDLIQYTCAVDRLNEKINNLYDPFHPAVLRLIQLIISNGHKEGAWVGMCGDMAGTRELVPVLLGMGLREFSMAPSAILYARKLARSLRYLDCKKIAETVLSLRTGQEVQDYLRTVSTTATLTTSHS